MFVELGDHLFCVDVVKLDGTVVCHTSKRLFQQMTELNLINGSRVSLLTLDL